MGIEREIITLARHDFVSGLALLDRALEEEPEAALTLYSQRDPRWRDVEYASGWTFGRAGCLVTCCAMVASYVGYTDTPPGFAAKLREQGCFIGGLLIHPQRIPAAYPGLRWDGYVTHWRRIPADLDTLGEYMDECPTILEVEGRPGGAAPPDDQHFVVGLGFTDAGDDLWIADPYDGTETLLLERYALDNWSLARAVYGARLLRAAL